MSERRASSGAGRNRTLRVHHSNRLESLAGELAGLIAADPAEPLTPERIVVPHQTMGRWLRLELARELGIAANLRFQQPAAFAWSILRDAVPSLPETQGFSPDTLRWHLFELLPDFARGADAGEVGRFLADGDERKRFELADKLAGVFDRCVNFREDWIRDWEQGATPHWQARLWRALAEKVPEQHWIHALDACRRQLASGIEPGIWPRRAFVFGVSALSPSYLRLLRDLAGTIELHVFLFNPSSEYWSELRTEREIRNRTENGNSADQHFEEGNRLLATWGRAGRDTFEALVGQEAEEQQCFPRPGDGTRLAAAQGDIQLVRDAAEAAAAHAVAPDDSLQIHCCHSVMREAEVLHDRLLGLLEANPDIEPADIMILTPDLARYGPAIAAVFEAEGRIPVTLSRFRAADSPTARAFFDILSLPGTRYGVEAVLAPLDAPSLRARFGIAEESLPAIRDWVGQAGIRRGVAVGDDAPALPGNSWREGLDRLLMGYATGDTDALALGVAPCAIRGEGGFEAGEQDHETLGRFIAYCARLFDLRSRVARPCGARRWGRILREVVDDFFEDGSAAGAWRDFAAAREAADEVGEIRSLVESFAQQAGRTECPISFAIARQVLRESAAGPALGPARLADGATIGKLAPGQVLPARIVCVAGMNGGGFPRNPPRHGFDLVEQDKRRFGDRDVRREDRFALLEALLAARSAFIVSYVGRDQRDDSDIPPSILVDELCDYLAVRFPAAAGGDGKAAPDSFRVKHPLQPFSKRYFSGDGELFSYSRTMRDAAQMLGNPTGTSPRRFRRKLPEPEAARRKITLAALARFFADPTRGFLKERFGIGLSEEAETIEEVEPLRINGLQRWGLREEIRDRTEPARADRAGPEDVKSLLLARGNLPHGAFGELAYARARAEVDLLKERLTPYAETLAAPPVNIDLKIDAFRLIGAIPNVDARRIVWWRNGRLRARDRIEARLLQLAWVAAGNQPLPVKMVFLGGEELMVEPSESIRAWLDIWWRGLSEPLHFFPESSFELIWEIRKRNYAGAMNAARRKWIGDAYRSLPGERDLLSNRLVWGSEGEEEALGGDFEELAQQLLLPIVELASS